MLGARLQEARKQAGYTQQSLAEALGVSLRSVTFWEANERTPSLDLLVRMSTLLSVSTDYLLGLTDKPLFAARTDDGVYFSTAKGPLDHTTEKPPVITESTFTLSEDEIPKDRQELEQFVRSIVEKSLADRRTT